MSQEGLGAMIDWLRGPDETPRETFYGRKIKEARIEENLGDADKHLTIEFEDGKKIALIDCGQSCCEARYLTCDDVVESLNGKTLSKIEEKAYKEDENFEWGDCHEQLFIEVGTEEGEFITLCNHNEHNGYYGGFSMRITEIDDGV